MMRTQPMRRTPFKRGKPRPERLALPVVPKQTGKMRMSKGPWRSPAYRKEIRSLWCLTCGTGAEEAHHVREMLPRSMGVRVSDEYVVPLCRKCHVELHKVNNATFWEKKGFNPLPWCREYKALWDRRGGNVISVRSRYALTKSRNT